MKWLFMNVQYCICISYGYKNYESNPRPLKVYCCTKYIFRILTKIFIKQKIEIFSNTVPKNYKSNRPSSDSHHSGYYCVSLLRNKHHFLCLAYLEAVVSTALHPCSPLHTALHGDTISFNKPWQVKTSIAGCWGAQCTSSGFNYPRAEIIFI